MVALVACGCVPFGQSASRPFKRSAPSKPIAEFPTPERLAAVEAKPVVLPAIESADVPPDGWTVDAAPAAPPADAAPWTPQGMWEEALSRAFSASGKRNADARHGLRGGRDWPLLPEEQGAPARARQRFIDASCGVFAPTVGFRSLGGAAPAGVTDDRLLAGWREQLRPDLIDRFPANARQVGFWAGRHGGRMVALAAYEANPVELKPFSLVPDARGDVTIEGRLDGDAASFAGYANQGRFGVSACAVDAAVPRPAFRITCHVAPDDETAWLEIVYATPRSVLETPLALVLARRDATRPPLFAEPPHAASRPVASEAAFAPAVLAGLNVARAEAGLQPVRLSDPESATAGRLARHYFAAALADNGADATGDMSVIALGLLAGWQVTGTIRDGSFFSVVVPHTRDAGRWLDSALALPLGRQTLLARDIEEIALGPALFSGPDGVGGIVCGYRFQHGEDHSADAELLLRRIVGARHDVNLPPPTRFTDVTTAIGRQLARVRQGIEAPIDALRLSLDEAAGRFGGRVHGYVVEATSIDAVQIPKELLRQPDLRLEIGVTHYRPPGAAWAQLVIVLVYVGAPTVEISRTGRARPPTTGRLAWRGRQMRE